MQMREERWRRWMGMSISAGFWKIRKSVACEIWVLGQITLFMNSTGLASSQKLLLNELNCFLFFQKRDYRKESTVYTFLGREVSSSGRGCARLTDKLSGLRETTVESFTAWATTAASVVSCCILLKVNKCEMGTSAQGQRQWWKATVYIIMKYGNIIKSNIELDLKTRVS